jgi:hypothetical protein
LAKLSHFIRTPQKPLRYIFWSREGVFFLQADISIVAYLNCVLYGAKRRKGRRVTPPLLEENYWR